MTEAEFLSEARIGQASIGRPAEDPELIFPALRKFLHSNGHHDMARVIDGLQDRFEEMEEGARLSRLIGA